MSAPVTDAIAFAEWLRDQDIDTRSWFADSIEELYAEFQRSYEVPGKIKRVLAHSKGAETNASSEDDKGVPDMTVGVKPSEANLVTSMIADVDPWDGERHAPVLDLDVPHVLVPSTTEGHSHLYLDVRVSDAQLRRLLDVLADCGIIERGYAEASKRRGYTAVRPPWVKKPGAPA